MPIEVRPPLPHVKPVEYQSYEQIDKPVAPVHREAQRWQSQYPILVPKYNRIYSSLKTDSDYDHVADINFYNLSITTVPNGQTAYQLVVPDQTINLDKWPKGATAHVCLNLFSSAPQNTAATVLCWAIQDTSGITVPIGNFSGQAGYTIVTPALILPGAIYQTGITQIGTLIVYTYGTTAQTIIVSLSFGVIYILPSVHLYDVVTKDVIHEALPLQSSAHHPVNCP